MEPMVSVIVTSYQRPLHLLRCLISLSHQTSLRESIEVIVADDGSTDFTIDMLTAMQSNIGFPLRWTTHPHNGFQAGLCRNEAVAVSRGHYLIFCDGDCVLPSQHIACHIKHRRPKRVLCGDCWRLPQDISERIDEAVIARSEFMDWIPKSELRRLRGKVYHSWLYRIIRHRTLPRLTGCDFSLWRSDFESVNGFDEEYRGWGYEDRDLQFRLSRAGVRFRSILRHSAVVHLWHPADPSFKARGLGTANRQRFEEHESPMYCLKGLDCHLSKENHQFARTSSLAAA